VTRIFPPIGEAHRRYTRRINFREGWRGHLWQGKYSSFIMEEGYLLACTRYLELKKHEQTGRPLEADSFIEKIELLLDRKLKPKKPGPKKKDKQGTF
jgi:hypothetical protein